MGATPTTRRTRSALAGGLGWGVIFAAAAPRLPAGGAYYGLTAALLGALWPTLVASFVVVPIKGASLAAG